MANVISVEEIFSKIKWIENATIAFTEERQMSLLRQKYIVSGYFKFAAPESIEKHILQPFSKQYLIHGDQFRVISQSHTSTRNDDPSPREVRYTISRRPAMASIIAGVRAALSGNLALLADHFKITSAGTAQQWQLLFAPVSEKISKHIQHIEISGRQSQIDRVKTVEADGDVSEMLFQPAS